MTSEVKITEHEEYHEETRPGPFRRMLRSVRHGVWTQLELWGWEASPTVPPPPDVQAFFDEVNASQRRRVRRTAVREEERTDSTHEKFFTPE